MQSSVRPFMLSSIFYDSVDVPYFVFLLISFFTLRIVIKEGQSLNCNASQLPRFLVGPIFHVDEGDFCSTRTVIIDFVMHLPISYL